MDPADKYYQAQKRHRDQESTDDKRRKIAAAWLNRGTVDAWRHTRMLSWIDPFLRDEPGSSWLTIGDGRYAFETRYVLQIDPSATVMTTDISESFLREAKERGLIQQFSVENAEALSFQDSSFDFVLCKESYHHFPRPYKALYEMIRVARRAVILIEPNDLAAPSAYRQKYRRIKEGFLEAKDIMRAVARITGLLTLSRKLRGFSPQAADTAVVADFEESGNFLYAISEREVEKVALGLGLQTVAFGKTNDYYEEGVEFEQATEDSILFQKVQAKIQQANKSGFYNVLCAVLFLRVPNEALKSSLRKHNYVLKDLPQNPYI